MNYEISLLSFLVCIAIASALSRLPSFKFLHNRESRFETLDGLRGFLALSVFFHHFVLTYYWKVNGIWGIPPENLYQKYGTVGVAIFFMITGFLFISKLQNSNWKTDWLKLLESRLFRIMPLYVFAVVSIVIIVLHNSDYQFHSSAYEIAIQLLEWAFFHGGTINEYDNTRRIIAGVDWTLKYEWLFYFSLPIISLIFSKKSKIVSSMFCLAIIILFIYPIRIMNFRSEFFILFLIGGYSAWMVRYVNIDKVNINSRPLSLIALALLIGMLFYPRTFDFIHVGIMSSFFALVVFGNDIFGLLRLKSAKILGEISYSIYLLHGLILYIIFSQLSAVNLKTISVNEYSFLMPFISVIVVLFSALTFLYIEQPFIKLGQKNCATSVIKRVAAQSKNI